MDTILTTQYFYVVSSVLPMSYPSEWHLLCVIPRNDLTNVLLLHSFHNTHRCTHTRIQSCTVVRGGDVVHLGQLSHHRPAERASSFPTAKVNIPAPDSAGTVSPLLLRFNQTEAEVRLEAALPNAWPQHAVSKITEGKSGGSDREEMRSKKNED